MISSPVDYGIILGVVALLVLPVMVDLIRHGVLVKLNTQARSRRKIQIAFPDCKRLLEITLSE